MSVGHGGQILVSAVTAELARDRLPALIDDAALDATTRQGEEFVSEELTPVAGTGDGDQRLVKLYLHFQKIFHLWYVLETRKRALWLGMI